MLIFFSLIHIPSLPHSIDIQKSLGNTAIVHNLRKKVVVGEVAIDPALGLLQTVSAASQEGDQKIHICSGSQMWLLANPNPKDYNVLLNPIGRLVHLLLGQFGQCRREWTSHFGNGYALFDGIWSQL